MKSCNPRFCFLFFSHVIIFCHLFGNVVLRNVWTIRNGSEVTTLGLTSQYFHNPSRPSSVAAVLLFCCCPSCSVFWTEFSAPCSSFVISTCFFPLVAERGLARLSDLYSEASFATFNDLCVKHNLPHLFWYFQALDGFLSGFSCC